MTDPSQQAQRRLRQPAYSVGIEAFDEAHGAMIERADALISAVQTGNDQTRELEILDDLVECAVEHFEDEERTLRELDWPGLDEHQQAHNLLLRTVLKFKSDLRYRRLTAEEASDFIVHWVLSHIRDEDMKYRDYLASRGVH